MPAKPKPPQTVSAMLWLLGEERKRLGFPYRNGRACTCGMAKIGMRCNRSCAGVSCLQPPKEEDADAR